MVSSFVVDGIADWHVANKLSRPFGGGGMVPHDFYERLSLNQYDKKVKGQYPGFLFR